jgi:hypothetical protein
LIAHLSALAFWGGEDAEVLASRSRAVIEGALRVRENRITRLRAGIPTERCT